MTHRKFQETPNENDAVRILADVFVRSGCLRRPNVQRRKNEGQLYKKGYEIRLTVHSQSELQRVRSSLETVGIKPASPSSKHFQIVQIAYGKSAFEKFVTKVLRRASIDTLPTEKPRLRLNG